MGKRSNEARATDEWHVRWRKERVGAVAELTKRGMRLKSETGGHNGPAPLGYINRRDGDRTWVEVDSATAPLVREAFRLYTAECLSIRGVASRIGRLGLLSRRGKPIGASAMRTILHNPFYAGYVQNGGRLFKGEHEGLVESIRETGNSAR